MHDAYSIVVLCVNDPHAGMKSIIEKASPSFKKGQTYWKENSLWSSFLFFRSFKAEMKMFLKRNNPFKVIAPSNQKKNFHSRIWPFILFFLSVFFIQFCTSWRFSWRPLDENKCCKKLEFSMHVSHLEVREKLAIPKGPRGDFFEMHFEPSLHSLMPLKSPNCCSKRYICRTITK